MIWLTKNPQYEDFTKPETMRYACGHIFEKLISDNQLVTDPRLFGVVCPNCFNARIHALCDLYPPSILARAMKTHRDRTFDEILAAVRVMLGDFRLPRN